MPDAEPRHALLLLLAICMPLFFVGLGPPSLWEPDEPRFAEATREMLARGDYLTPYFNGAPRFEKPILLYWMQLLFYTLLGVGELGARLPAALSGLGSVLLVYLLGARVMSRRAAFLGALAFATMFRIVAYARHGLTDMPLLFFILGALYFFQRTLDDEAGSLRFALLGWGFAGLAMLTKGPVALVALLVWVTYVSISGQRWALRRLHVVPGLAVFGLIGLSWYAYMIAEHGRVYLDLALFAELVDRVGAWETQPEPRGFFYFFKVWPADIAPWTMFFVAALGGLLASWQTLEPDEKRAALLLLTWFVGIQLFFSIPSGKLPHYIIPSYPAAALLVGLALDRAIELRASMPARALAAAGWVTGGLSLIAGVLGGLFLFRVFEAPVFGFSSVFPLTLIGGGAVACVFQWRRAPLYVFSTLATTFTIAYSVLALDTVPRYLEPFKPIRALAAVVVEELEPGDRVAAFRNIDAQSFVFYTRTTVEKPLSLGEVRELFAGPGRAFCLMRAEDLEEVERGHTSPLYVLDEGPLFFIRLRHLFEEDPRIDGRRAVIVSNRPRRS